MQRWLGHRIMARPHSHAMQCYRILMLAWVVALAGCSPSPVVTITNHSPVALNNVVVSGSGFSERIESIAAGAEHRVTARPRGESGLRVAVTVQSDLKVSVSSDLGGY